MKMIKVTLDSTWLLEYRSSLLQF